jgi:outer membrane protein TolC
MHLLARTFRTLLVASLLILTSTHASAEPLRLSLSEAVQRALREGTAAQLARSNEERARLARSEAFYAMAPQVEARLLRYNESINLQTFGFEIPGQPPVVGPFNVTDGQLTAAVQLFNLAAIRLYQSRQAGVAGSRFQLEQVENDVARSVAQLYVLVQKADAQIASRRADVTLFEQLARVAKDEFDAGTGTRLDVAQANLQVARAKELLLIAENDRSSTGIALLNAMAADEGTDLVLVDPLPEPHDAPALDIALSLARDTRPELKATAARKREAELAVASARARRIPRLSLDFQGDMSGNHADDLLWSRRIAGVLAVPIFRGDVEVAIARAKLEARDVDTQADSARRSVERDVRTAVLAMNSAAQRVHVADESIHVAEEALTIARDRKSAGYGSPVEVDRAEDQYQQAHESLIAAKADAALASVALQFATGEIRSLTGAAQ